MPLFSLIIFLYLAKLPFSLQNQCLLVCSLRQSNTPINSSAQKPNERFSLALKSLPFSFRTFKLKNVSN